MQTVREIHAAVSLRGEDTRQRLLEVALDIFGQHGFDGASTREIVQRAGANLTAIPYYFGSKEGLYVAAAEYMVTDCLRRMTPAMERTLREVQDPRLSRSELIRHLCDLLDDFAAVLMGPQMPDNWSVLFAREQMQPTAAFDKISVAFQPFTSVLQEMVAARTRDLEKANEAPIPVVSSMPTVTIARIPRRLLSTSHPSTEPSLPTGVPQSQL